MVFLKGGNHLRLRISLPHQKKQSGTRKKNAGERFLQLLISDVFFVEPSDVGGFFPPKSQRWDNLICLAFLGPGERQIQKFSVRAVLRDS